MPGGQNVYENFVVDRLEGSVAILLDESSAQVEVPLKDLPAKCRTEGAMLRVPKRSDGSRDWKRAQRDIGGEKRRMAENYARIERLKRRDPGGDISI